jgi:hypothetical protein
MNGQKRTRFVTSNDASSDSAICALPIVTHEWIEKKTEDGHIDKGLAALAVAPTPRFPGGR